MSVHRNLFYFLNNFQFIFIILIFLIFSKISQVKNFEKICFSPSKMPINQLVSYKKGKEPFNGSIN